MKTTVKSIPIRAKKMTKEEFMIQWVLARASFKIEFNGLAATEEASDVWDKIQRLSEAAI